MHKSSMMRMQWFKDNYCKELTKESRVIDLGSQTVPGQTMSYKTYFKDTNYIGVDMIEGNNVDIVLKNPYLWKEIESNSVDVLISGQAFEHIEFPWQTMSEIDRVLKVGGICCIIVPSAQPLHRYPVNTMNYFADGMIGLAKYVGWEILHASTNKGPCKKMPGWHNDTIKDTMLIARKIVDNFKFDFETYKLEPANLRVMGGNMVNLDKNINDDLPAIEEKE